jgi:iron(III) transport system ATP-binding protein
MVLHNPPDILSWADRVLVMQQGKLIQEGNPEEIYRHPLNEYCAGLFGMYNLIEPVPSFSAVLSMPPKGRKLFFRPEALRVADEGPGTIRGTIKEIHHWGSYYTLDIDVENQLVSMPVINPVVKKGDIIHFIILDDSVLFL